MKLKKVPYGAREALTRCGENQLRRDFESLCVERCPADPSEVKHKDEMDVTVHVYNMVLNGAYDLMIKTLKRDHNMSCN